MSPRPLLLGYHGVADVPRTADPHHLMLPPATFRAQVEALRDRSYTFVTVSEFVSRLTAGGGVSGLCALTFDDGSEDGAAVLPSLLAELEVPATFYVCPGLLGRPHPYLSPDAGVRLMTADEVAAVARLPHLEVGSHTNAHADLGAATAEEAYRELASSKSALEDVVGRSVESVAYPFCRYSAATPAAAERAGYSSGVTCAPLGGLHPYELRRQPVSRLDGRLTFALKTRGVYYPLWQSPPGRIARRLARRRRHGRASGRG